MRCRICETRKPRRYCPGVRGDICAPCCGAEREVSVECPLDCEYLREARARDRTPEVDPDRFPHPDIKVSGNFLRDNERLLTFASVTLLRFSLATRGAADPEVREALDCSIRTVRTQQSGLYYETRPSSPVAAAIQHHLLEQIRQFREQSRREGVETILDSEVLGILAFLQRLAIQHDNGRSRGRAFLDHLRSFFPDQPAPQPQAPQTPSLIIP
jgi:hypothetical protein